MPTQIITPNFPLSLAVYREIQAHLQQLPGIMVQLTPAKHQQFDYDDSQVVNLNIVYPENMPNLTQQTQMILQHYGITG
ncbi:MAG: hypothetical protein F6J87_16330 [Spirulina sp. SIO3F2]|nr:hypothetical protein [Spirulina sp. SIO3F2]